MPSTKAMKMMQVDTANEISYETADELSRFPACLQQFSEKRPACLMKLWLGKCRMLSNISLTALLCCIMAAAHVDAVADGTNWMAAIDGTKSLSELSVPGAHDAAALFEPFQGIAKCQNLSISDQLKAGVRFLDIRCYNAGKEFTIYHGVVLEAHLHSGPENGLRFPQIQPVRNRDNEHQGGELQHWKRVCGALSH